MNGSRHAFRAIAVTLATASALSIAGCSSDDPIGPSGTGTAAEVPPGAQIVTFDLVQEVTLEMSGIMDRRRTVIAEQAGWDAWWDEITTHVMPKPPAPTIDFTTRMVIAAAMGEQRGGGYSIDVLEVSEASDDLYVVVQESIPGVQCITHDAITSPAVAVSVPRSAGRVLFVEREIVYPCAP